MIQRIQTIFLFLAGVAFTSVILLPFATSDQTGPGVFRDGEYTIMDIPTLQILTYVAILAVLIGIFMYRRRRVQLRVGYGIILLGLVIPIVAYLYYHSPDAAVADVEIALGGFMPVMAALCVVVATYYIRKDERLVKSMDRLR